MIIGEGRQSWLFQVGSLRLDCLLHLYKWLNFGEKRLFFIITEAPSDCANVSHKSGYATDESHIRADTFLHSA